MKKQDGKTALQLILTISILVIIAGVSFAMIFGGTDFVSDIKELIQNDETENTNENAQNVQENQQ